MLKIKNNKILINRGDIAVLSISAQNDDGTDYIFKVDDVVRFKVMQANNPEVIFIQKDTIVEEEGKEVDIFLHAEDTTIGDLIKTPVNYWYEVELNPDTAPQTIIGYDDKGAKLFVLYPEGKKYEEEIIDGDEVSY